MIATVATALSISQRLDPMPNVIASFVAGLANHAFLIITAIEATEVDVLLVDDFAAHAFLLRMLDLNVLQQLCLIVSRKNALKQESFYRFVVFQAELALSLCWGH